jgi:putative hemin transport protein
VAPVEPPPEETPDEDIDVEGFLDAWGRLKDTHDFFPLLRDYEVSRAQALRFGEGRFTRRVPADSLRRTLQTAAEQETPIMVFVGSPGCLQIHSGPVKTLKATPPWYNVLDPGFQLHLNETMIDQAWVVEKPTTDGTVTSLELLDAEGSIIARLFGKRKPGQPEREDWRAILHGLPAEAQPALS